MNNVREDKENVCFSRYMYAGWYTKKIPGQITERARIIKLHEISSY